MFKTRGGGKGGLNNVKKTDDLVLWTVPNSKWLEVIVVLMTVML